MFIEAEEIGAGPDVGAIVRDINGDVAHDADVALAAIGAEGLPLTGEFPLPEFLLLDLAGELATP